MAGLIACNACGAVQTSDCTCVDADARLKRASDSPHVMFKWCRTCDRHYARCQCAAPDFYCRSGGKEIPVPIGGFHSVAGARVEPDLKTR